MATYINIDTSNFKPFTFEDIIKPLVMQKENEDKFELALDEKQKEAALLLLLSQNDVDEEEYNTYLNYLSYLNSIADLFSKSGLAGGLGNKFRLAKNIYNTKISPIAARYTLREELKLSELALYDKDPSILFAKPAATRQLKDYSNGMPLSLHVSGNALKEDATKFALSISLSTYEPPIISNSNVNQYYLLVERGGISKETMLNLINSGDPRVQNYINSMRKRVNYNNYAKDTLAAIDAYLYEGLILGSMEVQKALALRNYAIGSSALNTLGYTIIPGGDADSPTHQGDPVTAALEQIRKGRGEKRYGGKLYAQGGDEEGDDVNVPDSIMKYLNLADSLYQTRPSDIYNFNSILEQYGFNTRYDVTNPDKNKSKETFKKSLKEELKNQYMSRGYKSELANVIAENLASQYVTELDSALSITNSNAEILTQKNQYLQDKLLDITEQQRKQNPSELRNYIKKALEAGYINVKTNKATVLSPELVNTFAAMIEQSLGNSLNIVAGQNDSNYRQPSLYRGVKNMQEDLTGVQVLPTSKGNNTDLTFTYSLDLAKNLNKNAFNTFAGQKDIAYALTQGLIPLYLGYTNVLDLVNSISNNLRYGEFIGDNSLNVLYPVNADNIMDFVAPSIIDPLAIKEGIPYTRHFLDNPVWDYYNVGMYDKEDKLKTPDQMLKDIIDYMVKGILQGDEKLLLRTALEALPYFRYSFNSPSNFLPVTITSDNTLKHAETAIANYVGLYNTLKNMGFSEEHLNKPYLDLAFSDLAAVAAGGQVPDYLKTLNFGYKPILTIFNGGNVGGSLAAPGINKTLVSAINSAIENNQPVEVVGYKNADGSDNLKLDKNFLFISDPEETKKLRDNLLPNGENNTAQISGVYYVPNQNVVIVRVGEQDLKRYLKLDPQTLFSDYNVYADLMDANLMYKNARTINNPTQEVEALGIMDLRFDRELLNRHKALDKSKEVEGAIK